MRPLCGSGGGPRRPMSPPFTEIKTRIRVRVVGHAVFSCVVVENEIPLPYQILTHDLSSFTSHSSASVVLSRLLHPPVKLA